MALKRWWVFLLLVAAIPCTAQVFGPCFGLYTASNSAGACTVSNIGGGGGNFTLNGTANGTSPGTTGGIITPVPAGTHIAMNVNYHAAVNVQAFTTAITYVPNGWNISLTINNCANNGSTGSGSCGGFSLASFSSGAGCEGSIYQGFTGANPGPYNIFALKLNQFDGNTAGSNTFSYSGAQIYQQNESPCNGNLGGQLPYISANYVSTSPMPLNSPASTVNTCVQTVGGTCDTMKALIGYDGSNFSLCMYDVTLAAGSCSSSTSGTGVYFQNTWTNVSIPSLVDGTTAYVGLAGGTNAATAFALQILDWQWNTASVTGSITSTVTSDGGTHISNPTLSPVAGTYSGAQSVSISCPGAPSGSYACYNVAAAGQAILPQPNNLGACGTGTLYSSAVSVPSTSTLYATCGVNNNTSANYLSSGYIQAAYTINAGGTGGSAIGPGVSLNGVSIQ